MPWATASLEHKYVTGKQKTDTVTKDPETGVSIADPIPTDNDLLTEARGLIEREALAMNAAYVQAAGGITAFLDAAISQQPALTYTTLACAYLVFWNAAALTEEGDRLWLMKRDHMDCVKKGITALLNLVSKVDTTGPRMKGRVSSVDAWGTD